MLILIWRDWPGYVYNIKHYRVRNNQSFHIKHYKIMVFLSHSLLFTALSPKCPCYTLRYMQCAGAGDYVPAVCRPGFLHRRVWPWNMTLCLFWWLTRLERLYKTSYNHPGRVVGSQQGSAAGMHSNTQTLTRKCWCSKPPLAREVLVVASVGFQ